MEGALTADAVSRTMPLRDETTAEDEETPSAPRSMRGRTLVSGVPGRLARSSDSTRKSRFSDAQYPCVTVMSKMAATEVPEQGQLVQVSICMRSLQRLAAG